MSEKRIELLKSLGRAQDSSVIVYFLGDRRGLDSKIAVDALDVFVSHLDTLSNYNGKLSLYLFSNGGDTSVAWSIANLLRQFCRELEIIVPAKARSAATLLCLSADRIVMTKQATLGPIDPTIDTPLNPGIPGAPESVRYSVSVEAIQGFIELAKDNLKIEGSEGSAVVLQELVKHVHPLVLGEVFRRQKQIKDLARRLLDYHLNDGAEKDKIVDFLASESGSHDYTINRKEAGGLGLPVEKPGEKLYKIIDELYRDYSKELELATPFDKTDILGESAQTTYRAKRAIIESLDGGTHEFVTKGTLTRTQVTNADGISQEAVHERKEFEGWTIHE